MWLLLAPALANGLTTHVWIAMEARSLLPEGELASLVNDPAVERMLRNGAAFPDGGYPLGHPYAETAHWEPFQSLLLDYIRETYGPPPYEGEARELTAFLLGMAAHGISDQTFDSMYFERGYVYDADSDFETYGFDEATDVALAAGGGAQPVPEPWIPYDVLIPLFAEAGVEVDADTLDQGQALTGVAIASVAAFSEVPDTVEMYHDRFPWSSEHILDVDVKGSPPNEAVVTALYWQQLWARLSGTWTFDDPLMVQFPAATAWDHPTDGLSIESQVSFLVTRGLVVSSLLPGTVTVEDGTGHVYVPEPRLFYRESSHAILLLPNEDWAEGEDFTVTVAAGLATIGGDVSEEPFQFTFTTRSEPVVEEVGPEGCGCATAPAPGIGLVGAALAVLRRGITAPGRGITARRPRRSSP